MENSSDTASVAVGTACGTLVDSLSTDLLNEPHFDDGVGNVINTE